MEDMLEVPGNLDPEFKDALSALVRSAAVMRQVLMMIVGAGIDPERLMKEHGEVIVNAEKVIVTWCEHLGIEE